MLYCVNVFLFCKKNFIEGWKWPCEERKFENLKKLKTMFGPFKKKTEKWKHTHKHWQLIISKYSSPTLATEPRSRRGEWPIPPPHLFRRNGIKVQRAYRSPIRFQPRNGNRDQEIRFAVHPRPFSSASKRLLASLFCAIISETPFWIRTPFVFQHRTPYPKDPKSEESGLG